MSTQDAIYGRCQVCSMRATIKTQVASWCSTCWADAFAIRGLERTVEEYEQDDLMPEWVRCRKALLEYRTERV